MAERRKQKHIHYKVYDYEFQNAIHFQSYCVFVEEMSSTIDCRFDNELILVFGSSNSGKSRAISTLLSRADLFKNVDNADILIMIFSTGEQTTYDSLCQNAMSGFTGKVKICFYRDVIPTMDLINTGFYQNSNYKKRFVIIDDFVYDLKCSRLKASLLRYRHENITYILTIHNLYDSTNNWLRFIFYNATYLALFKTWKLARQVSLFMNELSIQKEGMTLYRQVTEIPYTYLLICLKPYGDDMLRFRSNPTEFWPRVFVKSNVT